MALVVVAALLLSPWQLLLSPRIGDDRVAPGRYELSIPLDPPGSSVDVVLQADPPCL